MSVSLVMPVHNEAKHLKYSLEPILRVYWLFMEVIFVLDRCTDNSRVVIESNMRDNFRIIVKSTCTWRNRCAEAKNLGVRKAEGQIIFHIDADIIFDDAKLLGGIARITEGLVDIVSFTYRYYSLYSLAHRPLDEWINLFGSLCRKLKIQPGRGGVYLIRRSKAQISDVPSEYDILQKEFRTIQMETSTLHLRPTYSKQHQIERGAARVGMRQYNPLKIVLAAILQFQPYLLVGYLKKKISEVF